MTGLHLATYFGVEEATNCLLQKTVETDAKDTYSRTPLSYAAAGGHKGVIELLVKTGKADVNLQDGHGRTPLWYAAVGGYEPN
ncbi:ankyrin repeat protein [Thelonectria olida]|uniref:Ankyrin repeat protein n=1 Tax=Thelonectria olida TaxID=1576542 RepID=A0A9P9AIT2_9HYPO|nr:ankyrin repeat protein [Thelonectria olida]